MVQPIYAEPKTTDAPKTEPTKPPEQRQIEAGESPRTQQPVSKATMAAANTANLEQAVAPAPDTEAEHRLAQHKANWQGALAEHLERYKRYPPQAKQRREQGDVIVRFVITASGEVLEAEIDKSSGSFFLDREVRQLVRRAQPLPQPPAGIQFSRIEVVVPINFALR